MSKKPSVDISHEILKHLPLAIVICDTQGKVTWKNVHYEQYIEDKKIDAYAQVVFDLSWVKQVNVQDQLLNAFEDKKTFEVYRKEYITQKGDKVFVDVHVLPIYNRNRVCEDFMIMLVDSTHVQVSDMQIHRYAQQLSVINQVTQAINSTMDISEILWIILRNVHKLFGEDSHVTIAMIQGDEFEKKETYPPKFIQKKEKRPLHITQGIVGHVLRTKQLYYSNDVFKDPYYVNDESDTQSELAVPIIHKNNILGVINIESPQKNCFSPNDIEVMTTFANNIAVVISNAQLYQTVSESEEKYRTLVMESITGIYIIQDQKFKYTNPAFQRMLGYTHEELQNLNYLDVLALDHPSMTPLKHADLRNPLGLWKEKEHFTIIGKRKDGRYIDIEGKYAFTFIEGKWAVQGYALDVTKTKKAVEALRESEKKYANLVERAHDGIVIVQYEKVVFANKAFHKIFQVTEQEILGLSCYDLFSTDSQKRLKKFFESDIERQIAHPILELDAIGKKKIKKFVTINIAPIEYMGQIAYMFIMRDDTKRKRLENNIRALNKDLEKKVLSRTDELQEANYRLKEAMDLKSQFIANSSHELRTPLTIIKGNLELAMHPDVQVSDIQESLQAVNMEVDYMSKLLSELSLLTKADSLDQKTILVKPVVFHELVEHVYQASLVVAQKEGVKLEIECLDEAVVWGNIEYLERLLHNLVSNGIKYNKKGGFVKMRLEEKDTHYLFSVTDNGIGIAEKELPYIFERFYRTSEARAKQVTGTGLGLPICQWIVQAHKGVITVKSIHGKGTQFDVSLPKYVKRKKDNTMASQYH